MGVSPAWFYKWRDGDPSPRRARREQLTAADRPAVRRAPRPLRLAADHRRPARGGLAGQREHRREDHGRAGAGGPAAAAPPQHRPARAGAGGGHRTWSGADFAADGLNRKWYGDGTEIATDEGKLYLDSVLDMASRRIVGFALGEHHDAELAYAALAMAVAVRGGREAIAGVMLHTDQGSEYTAGPFRAACARLGIRQSMGRPGSALDNAVIESWHSTLEFELRRLEHFATKAQARARVAAWIEEYNHDRRHSALGMLSPIAYERSPAPTRPAGGGGMTGLLPATQRGTVLAGVKATPCGWPTASLDPGCGPCWTPGVGASNEGRSTEQDQPN